MGSHIARQSFGEERIDDNLLQACGQADHNEGEDDYRTVRVVHQEESHRAYCSHSEREHEFVPRADLVGKKSEERQEDARANEVYDFKELVDVPGLLPDHLVVQLDDLVLRDDKLLKPDVVDCASLGLHHRVHEEGVENKLGH